MMGVKVLQPKTLSKYLVIQNYQSKKIIIQKYLKDHRVFMTSVIAALSFGGEWHIHDKDAIKTSFPSFLRIINIIKK